MRHGKWETIRELGRGGQGTAYLAVNTERLNPEAMLQEVRRVISEVTGIKTVEQNEKNARLLFELVDSYLRRESAEFAAVVKVLHEPARRDAKALARLEHEVEVLRRIKHPHLITVLDASVPDGWFVTPYFQAGPLSENLHRFAGDPVRSLNAFRDLVHGVGELHRIGVVHRDIKPENVFLGPTGLVLGDFGIVYFEDEARARVSDTYENVGSRDWMPGWAMGMRVEDVRPSFDVFGLGKVLWVMVSGKTKLRLWYFRQDEFNVERRFPGDERMRWVNRLLEGSVREHEGEVWRSGEELLGNVDEVSAILRRGGQIVNRGIPRTCSVCGNGGLRILIDETRGPEALRNFGLNPAGERFRIFACENCGNVQWFRMTTNPPGWGEAPR
jgi:serine/threonine protein kinase